jgi:hypothetical protein
MIGIGTVLHEILVDTLQRVFEHWMARPEWISLNNGQYYPQAKDSLIWFV